MAAGDEAAGFRGLVVAAAQHRAQHFPGQGRRKADHIQRDERAPAHGVNIAERVGGGHQAEFVGVVGDGGEEIDRQHQAGAVVEAVNGGVVAGGGAHQQVGMAGGEPRRQLL